MSNPEQTLEFSHSRAARITATFLTAQALALVAFVQPVSAHHLMDWDPVYGCETPSADSPDYGTKVLGKVGLNSYSYNMTLKIDGVKVVDGEGNPELVEPGSDKTRTFPGAASGRHYADGEHKITVETDDLLGGDYTKPITVNCIDEATGQPWPAVVATAITSPDSPVATVTIVPATAAAPPASSVNNKNRVRVFDTEGNAYLLNGDDVLNETSLPAGTSLNMPIVGGAKMPNGDGYWEVAADGGVFSNGDARFYGSAGGIKLNQPVVGMAATPSGEGYWLVASDGGIFAYGDAGFYGSTGSIKLNKPIVGMTATKSGKGYWLAASDGGIFAYGDAAFEGSAGNVELAKPVVGMDRTNTGNGYWLVASDGGILSYGDAKFEGSAADISLQTPVVGMAAVRPTNLSETTASLGYNIVTSDGNIFPFGTKYPGNTAGRTGPDNPLVGGVSDNKAVDIGEPPILVYNAG